MTSSAFPGSELLRTVLHRVPSMFAYFDTAVRCRFVNEAYASEVGMPAAAAVGRTMLELVGPDAYAKRLPFVERALAGEAQTFELDKPLGDTPRQFLFHFVPDSVDGVVRGIVVEIADITPLRSTQAALQQSEAFLDRTGRVAGIGAWEIDLRSRRVRWSRQTHRICETDEGYVPEFLGGARFYPPDAWSTLKAAVDAALTGGPPIDLELPFITARGKHRWVRVTAELEREAGVPVRLLGAIQDVTERRRQAQDFQDEQVKRERSERHAAELDRLLTERSQMLDVLAHEVRQPLNNASAAIQGAAAVVAAMHEHVASGRLVRAQAVLGQVMASIDNTLAVASLLARPEPVQRVDMDIDTLLGVVLAELSPADRQRVKVARETDSRSAPMDTSLMRLALRNLLSNALRYGNEGCDVSVRVADSENPLGLIIDVGNAGSRLPDALVEKLFVRGEKPAPDPAHAHGMGLGLYIVRRVMEMHEGSAQLLSQDGGAIVFRLVLGFGGD